MKTILITAGMLVLSNIFMTIAWYGHLKNLSSKPWFIAALISWGIALFEYLIQVPANRLGNTVMTIPQLKIMQEAIALTVFIPISVFFLKEKITLDYIFAMICLLGAVFFIFRAKLFGGA
ncbi:MAG: DMT family protein [Proteobacteria bacterium]|nr:DMT family protein [Pseudomonadota bacterium]